MDFWRLCACVFTGLIAPGLIVAIQLGVTYVGTAAAMFLAEGTIKNYVSRIMEKLHANTRTALAVISAKQRRPD